MTEKWPDLAGQIQNGVHILATRVYYEDTDFSGYVYHANYIKYCERGRSDCLRVLGVHHGELFSGDEKDQAAWVVRHMDCDFIAPAHIDQVLEVHTKFASAKGARVVMEQSVFNGEKLLFKAVVTAALISANGRPRRLSPGILKSFEKLSRQ